MVYKHAWKRVLFKGREHYKVKNIYLSFLSLGLPYKTRTFVQSLNSVTEKYGLT